MTIPETARPEPLIDHAPLLERAFERPPVESSYRIDRIAGELPGFLRGTYYLNGPARFERGGRRYAHWLDGDGMVCAFHFRGDGVRFVNRFVRSRKLTLEEEAGRPLFRAFGTSFPGDRLRHGIGLETPVNVSAYRFGGQLLAFGEQGLPYALDPETLETRGEHTFDGRLKAVSPFAAHPAFDHRSGEMFNFGVSFSPRHPAIHLYRFGADGEARYRRRIALDRPYSMHDFGLSASWAVFYVAPYVLETERLLRGSANVMDALRWRPELGSRLLIAAREDGSPRAEVPIGSGHCLHLIDCFERGRELVVDVLELDRPVYDQYRVPHLFSDGRQARPVRLVLDPAAGKLVERLEFPYREMCDFPIVDPRLTGRDYREFWMLGIGASHEPGRKFFDRLVYADWSTGRTREYRAPRYRYLAGEPAFAPDPRRPGEGALLCPEYDAFNDDTTLLVFEPRRVDRGPVARLLLRHPIHLAFHASFHARAETGA